VIKTYLYGEKILSSPRIVKGDNGATANGGLQRRNANGEPQRRKRQRRAPTTQTTTASLNDANNNGASFNGDAQGR
jgi:hypothetical protein